MAHKKAKSVCLLLVKGTLNVCDYVYLGVGTHDHCGTVIHGLYPYFRVGDTVRHVYKYHTDLQVCFIHGEPEIIPLCLHTHREE